MSHAIRNSLPLNRAAVSRALAASPSTISGLTPQERARLQEVSRFLSEIAGPTAAEPSSARLAHPRHRLAHLHHQQSSHSGLPSLRHRAPAMARQASQLAPGAASAPSLNNPDIGTYVPPADGGNSAIDNAIANGAFSTAPTATEQKMLDGITDPSQKAQMTLQLQMQKQAQIASMVTNILNILHTTSMSIVGNMRS